MLITEAELSKRLLEAGNKLLPPPSEVPELLDSLNLVESLLAGVEQSPSETMREALAPSTKALIAEELLRHPNADVKVAVAACISEITRITAPDAPYADHEMKEVFQLIVSSFEKLDDKSSISYIKRTSILETLARVRSCVVMLDLECDDLILEMFQHFFKTIRDDHHDGVFTSMETIMTLVVEESEGISVDLLSSILNTLKKEDKDILPIARVLGERIFHNCAYKLKPYLLSALRSSGASLDDYSKIVADVSIIGDEAVKPTDHDIAKENSADEKDLVNAASEKAVEVAMETMEDAPPSEEVGPSTVGSPKTATSNGVLKGGNEETLGTNDDSKEADNDAQDEEAEPSKTEAESVADEEPLKSKPQTSNRRKGRKSNTTKSSESFEPIMSDRKNEVIDTPEHEKNDAKDDDIKHKDPTVDTTVTAHNGKSLEEPILSPITSDNAHADVSPPSPTESRVEESSPKNRELKNEKESPIVESVSAGDVDSKKVSDTQQYSEEATGVKNSLNKHTSTKLSPESDHEEKVADSANDMKGHESILELHSEKRAHTSTILAPASDHEEKVADSANDMKEHGSILEPDREKRAHPIVPPEISDPNSFAMHDDMKGGDKIIGLDGNSAKEVVQETEVESGIQALHRKKQAHPINTPAKHDDDTQQDSEGATGLENSLNKRTSKNLSSASDHTERVADSANYTKEGDSAKEVVQEPEVESIQALSKEKRAQPKAIPATKSPNTLAKHDDDIQQDSEGATGVENSLNKRASKKISSASDHEEKVADSAKEVVQETEVGSTQQLNKKKRAPPKTIPAKGYSKTPAKDDKKKTVALPKTTPKATKDGSGKGEASKSGSKRKRPSEEKEKAQQTKVYGAELVGAKVEVYWPDDNKYYKGVVKSFDAAEKEHKIFYNDGDVELLDLKNEIWRFVDGHKGNASDGESPDESADETPKGKKAKTVSSTKMSGASLSKAKSARKSSSAKKEDSKSAVKTKEEASKKIGKSVSKSSTKSAKKSKDDVVEDSPKGSIDSREGTSAKSKGNEDTEDESLEPEKSKPKPQSTSKSQKNSNKRKRSAKA